MNARLPKSGIVSEEIVNFEKLRDKWNFVCYTKRITSGIHQSTTLVFPGQKKEVVTIPRDSRCGIVETCRNASTKPG